MKMGSDVQEVAQRDLHEDLLDAGILGVLKAWLEPMSDGTLPNLKIRSAVLRTLINLNFLYEVRQMRRWQPRCMLRCFAVQSAVVNMPDQFGAVGRAAKHAAEQLVSRRRGATLSKTAALARW